MDEILKNIFPAAIEAAKQHHQEEQQSNNNNNIDDVWTDIVAEGGANHLHHQQHYHHPSSDEGFSACGAGGGDEVTLEDFLVKAGAVPYPHHQYPSSSSAVDDGSHSLQVALGKRKTVDETLDKAALQKQKRMIKNRESAARSRERKQAYTTELESLVKHLEIENKQLEEEQAERKKLRLKQLQEFLIPITEQPRPKRKLRRSNSS